MKKIAFLIVVSLFLLAGSSFAALTDQSAGGVLDCGTGDVIIQLSPKIFAAYSGLDRFGTADFYISAAYHTAGTKVYATASTLTKIYRAKASVDNTLAALYALVPTTVADAESEAQWSGDLWSAE